MSYDTKEKRISFLLERIKRQTDQWLKEDEYDAWQKSNKPKKTYSFKPKRTIRTKDIYRGINYKKI